MKKIVSIALSLCMLFMLAACGSDSPADDTTITPPPQNGESNDSTVPDSGTPTNDSGNQPSGGDVSDTSGTIVEAVNTTFHAGNSSAFIKSDGSLWTFGNNQYGQLGDGTKENRVTPVKIADDVRSVVIGGTLFYIKNDDSVWGCGDGMYLGIEDSGDLNVPVKITDNASMVSSNGITVFVLKKDGSLWGAGHNRNGQLGNSADNHQQTLIKIMDDVKYVSAGGYHTLVVKTDGSLWSSGNNESGQLGDGTFESKLSFVKIMDGVRSASASLGPHTGQIFSLILKEDGTLWGCGSNNSGPLGIPETYGLYGEEYFYNTPVFLMDEVAAINAGSMYSMIIKTDGTLWVCGSNIDRALGVGAYAGDQQEFVMIAESVAAVSAGGSTSAFLKSDGSLWSSGENSFGQLGTGASGGDPFRYDEGIDHATPVMIAEGIALP